MKRYTVQMIDNTISSDWWKKLIGHFMSVGDPFEIRCWKEEITEIAKASVFGTATEEKNEVSIKGWVTQALRRELLEEEPAEKMVYNKMTSYFTIHVNNSLCDLWSGHYGTEMQIGVASDEARDFLERVMGQYPEQFCIGCEDGVGKLEKEGMSR